MKRDLRINSLDILSPMGGVRCFLAKAGTGPLRGKSLEISWDGTWQADIEGEALFIEERELPSEDIILSSDIGLVTLSGARVGYIDFLEPSPVSSPPYPLTDLLCPRNHLW